MKPLQCAWTFGLARALTLACIVPSSRCKWRESEPAAYPKYPGRKVWVLDGAWDFAFLGGVEFRAAAAVREEEFCRKVTVPDAFDQREWLCPKLCTNTHTPGQPCSRCCDLSLGPRGDNRCWQDGQTFEMCCDPAGIGRRGVAAYRTYVPREVSLLHFGACSMHCAVYADRRLVGEHVGGYSPFWLDLRDAEGGEGGGSGVKEVELLVLADNRFSPLWPVHQPYFDWYQAGGLLRSVEAHALHLPNIFIRRVEVLPQRELSTVAIRVLFSCACVARGLQVFLAFDSASFGLPRLVAIQSNEEVWIEHVPQPRLWSLATPALHTLVVSMWDASREIDRIVTRFGLRWVEASRGQVLINGEAVMLRGVNRHESHVFGGAALSSAQIQEDMLLLREMGANFVRGAHYSQDQRWLDACDEYGVLVWEETLGWQPRLEHLTDNLFMSQQLLALEETMNASANHPSVIMWGFLNEAESDSVDARPAHKALANLARSRDSTRLVTWASRKKTMDETLDLADVISFNDYPGWYDASIQEIPEVWEKYAEWARARFPGKPIIIGEVGADGLAGFQSPGHMKWSEDLQAAMVQASLVAAHASRYAGVGLWQFSDSRVDTSLFFEDNPRTPPFENSSEAEWVEDMAKAYEATVSPYGFHLPLRPRQLNSKGLVSLDRKYRKAAFEVAREAFRGSCPVGGGTAVPTAALLAPLGQRAWSSAVRFAVVASPGRAVWCDGCFLAVHTWNAADRPAGEPGIRVHVHARHDRATLWALAPSGLLRIAGHADGRQTALGAFLSVVGERDDASRHVSVREAAGNLWAPEATGAVGELRLRVTFGPACGAYLVAPSRPTPSDERDESSAFVLVHRDPALATLWRVLPGSGPG